MANVFISYARRDKERVLQLTSALESEGLSVWWDSDLVPGRRYRQMIAEQLTLADSVIVVWTAAALQSDWVQDEAEEGRQRGVLIPVILEPVRAPAGFRQVQAADLSQWTGSPEHPEFRSLLFAVRSLVQIARATGKDAPPPTPGSPVAEADDPDRAQSIPDVRLPLDEPVPGAPDVSQSTDRPPLEQHLTEATVARAATTATAASAATAEVTTVRQAPMSAPGVTADTPTTVRGAWSDMMFRWRWWLCATAAMIASTAGAELSGGGIKALTPFLLCAFPVLAGAAAMACRNANVSGAARTVVALIGLAAAGLAIPIAALQLEGQGVRLFASLFFGLLSMSVAFGLAAAAAYMIGSFRPRS